MGKKHTPAPSEPKPDPPELGGDVPLDQSTSPTVQDEFPDHGPIPLHTEDPRIDEEASPPPPTQDFYRATSDPDLHQPYVPKKRVKVRRKNEKSSPEWDRDENQALPTESEPSRRGRRKRRPPTKLERFLLFFSPKFFIYFAAALLLAFLVAAISNFLKDPEAESGGNTVGGSAPSDSGSIMDSFLTEATRQKVLAALEAYFAAENWEQKLPFVRQPERVRPLMENWYSRPENLGTDAPTTISPTDFQKQVPIGDRIFIMVAIMVAPENRIQFCSIEQIDPETHKIDWEVTELYREVPLREFKDSHPQTPVPFRVLVRDANYFNGQFSDETRYRSFSLTNPADPDFKLWAYVERGTPLESQMNDFVPPLTSASLILDLAYPQNPTSDDQVLIKSIAHPNWFY